MAHGAVTGVLDWPNAALADPAYDVATTRTILLHADRDGHGATAAALARSCGAVGDRLAARFAELTGIVPELP